MKYLLIGVSLVLAAGCSTPDSAVEHQITSVGLVEDPSGETPTLAAALGVTNLPLESYLGSEGHELSEDDAEEVVCRMTRFVRVEDVERMILSEPRARGDFSSGKFRDAPLFERTVAAPNGQSWYVNLGLELVALFRIIFSGW